MEFIATCRCGRTKTVKAKSLMIARVLAEIWVISHQKKNGCKAAIIEIKPKQKRES